MGLRPPKEMKIPGAGCPTSRAFLAREVGIFDRAKPKGSGAEHPTVFPCGLRDDKISGNDPD
jgi:hypothetical protein